MTVDHAGRSRRACQELGRVAATRADIEHRHSWTDADESQHLLRFATQVVGPVGRTPIRAGDDLGNPTGCQRFGRVIGGQTGDLIGALQALLEIAALTAFMIFV